MFIQKSKDWVQMPFNTTPTDSLESSSHVYRLPLVTCANHVHPQNFHIITLARACERDLIGLHEEERRGQEDRR